MSRRALILAAHGSRADASVNEDVRRCAQRVAELTNFDEVVAAFHAGEPTFADVLDRVRADRVTVVPLMTSAGYYGDVVLPRELARNRRYAGKSVCITRPIGEHPALAAMVVSLVERRLRLEALVPEETTVVLVGHGTRRHAGSRQATIDLVAAVRGFGPCPEVLPAFLEDSPGVDTILARATGRNLLVLPFLISGGWHATRDIPAAVGLMTSDKDRAPVSPLIDVVGDRFTVGEPAAGWHWQAPMVFGACPRVSDANARGQTRLPMAPAIRASRETVPPLVSGTVGDRFVVCEPAIGTHPDIVELVADLANETEVTSLENRATTGEALEQTL